LAAIPLALGLERVYSASSGFASALPPPTPTVTVAAPVQALIGTQVKFKVTFDNAGAVGYGPFVDLVLNAGGANAPKPCPCDGLTFVSAKLVGVNGGPVMLTPSTPTPTLTTPCGSAPTTVPHPFASSGVLPVNLPAGGQLITLELPFGSVDPTQPAFEVEVTANLSNLADVNYPLKIWARGGFRFGTDPLDNPFPLDPPILSDTITNSSAWNAQAQITPKVMIINKAYLGPEGENATGPNFIGFYPLRYKLTVEVAPGQTVTNVVLTDCLPDNMAFHQLVSVTPAAAPITLPLIDVPGASPNCLTVNWLSLTGSATVIFEFFIPEKDASGNPVLPANCAPANSKDTLNVTADWTPLDSCDQLQQLSEGPVVDTLLDKCIAIQKSVALFTDTGAPGYTPGDILKYTLNFQISDYKTFGSLLITDALSDGQKLVSPAPTLSVKDQYGTMSGNFVSGSDLLAIPDPSIHCGNAVGGTKLSFLVSQKMMSLGSSNPTLAAGILTGGLATSTSSSTPATGQIVFFVKISDQFAFPQQPGDQFVDKEDPIGNCVVVRGRVMTNVNPPALPTSTGAIGQDDSSTAISIVGDTLTKSVYAVKRSNALGSFNIVCGPLALGSPRACSNLPNPPEEVRPGDQVTFRLEKTIPSTDAEMLTVEDWLPRPTFDVNGSTFTGSPCAIPIPGKACLGPTNALLVSPTFFANPVTNSIKFDYGTFDDPANLPRKIDLLFTYTVTNLPFADELFLTNEAQECETNTFGKPFCQVAIAQVNVRQPELRIRKAVVATSNPNASFTPSPPAPSTVVFNLGGFVSGLINSTNVGLINSNVTNVDANDTVTFTITVENVGGSPAYDVKIKDIIPTDSLGNPSCFTIVPNSFQVKRGTGALVVPGFYTIASTSNGFTIQSNPSLPIPLSAYNPTSGANIVVITFQAKLLANIKPGCCDNKVKLEHYASTLGGPDFVTTGLTPPFDDPAQVCVKPTLTKWEVATSETHTVPQASVIPQTAANTPQLTIGEVARYRLLVVVPEGGVLSNFQVTDALPAGMKFMGAATSRIAFIAQTGITRTPLLPSPAYSASGNVPLSSIVLASRPQIPPVGVITGGTSCGSPVTFNLGNVQNNDNDNDLEYIEIEFNALVCNVMSNQNGVSLGNTFSVSAGGVNLATSNQINVKVVEPKLTIAKAVSPATILQGGTASYTVTITNQSPVQAYDMQFSDTLPPGLTFVPSSVTVGGSCLPAPGISATSPAVTCSQIPANGTVAIKYKAVVNAPACPATLTNKAAVTWTSLPANGTPVGINNLTGSITPGPSGAANGERNGTTAPLTLNDYAAISSAALKVTCPPCATPPQGMVGWWPLDEPNGATVVNDIALVNNQGTSKPGSPLGSASAPNAIAGRVGGALNFNSNLQSTGPNIEVPDHPEINFGTGDLSIDTWVFVPKPPAVYIHPIVDKLSINSTGTQGTGYALYLVSSLSNGARLQFVMGGGGALASYLAPTAPVVPFDNWTHVAVTVSRSLGTVVFYINGVPLNPTGSPMPATSITNNIPLLIGESRQLGLAQAAIALDELEMFNRRLTPNEILSIVNAGPTGKCKCLLASNEKISCNPNGTFNYSVTLKNLSGATVNAVNFSTAANVTITPANLSIPPLAPGASTTVTVTISGPGATSGATVCFFVGLGGGPLATGCRVEHCVTLPTCQTSACATPPAGMVSWWPLNETGGNTVLDIKGGHNGTTSANIGSDPLSATSPKVGNALLFLNSKATVAGSFYNFGTGNFSIDAWVRGPVSNAALGIVDKLDTSTAIPTGFAFFIRSGTVQLVMGNGTATPATFMSTTAFTYGSWQHVAVTVQRVGVGSPIGRFYLNGAPAGTFVPPLNSVDNGANLLLGNYHLNVGCSSCEVSLDEIEIFNTAVSASDIKAIFAAGGIGKCKATLSGLKFGQSSERIVS
jgi:uncharacterized repeat protein (TIGR01451 family)